MTGISKDTQAGNEPGFKETKDGLKYKKDQYGLHVDETHDYPHVHRGQGKAIVLPPTGSELNRSLLKDGFVKISREHIGPANQAKILEKFQEPGHKSEKSKTASGHNRKGT
jgi:hypothetical protein